MRNTHLLIGDSVKIRKPVALPHSPKVAASRSSGVHTNNCRIERGGGLGAVVKVALFSVGILLCVPTLAQSDWTQWRGANRDGSVSLRARSGDWPPQLVVRRQ